MKEKILSGLSVFTSLFAALCWTGGILLAPLGLGALGTAYFANLTKFKPLFVLLTGGLIYWSYSIIEKKNSGRKTKIFFWLMFIVSTLLIFSPNILEFFGII